MLSWGAAQVLAEQCRRLGVDIEASISQTAALAQASNGVSVNKKKPGWNLDISSIHRRIKDDIRNSSSSSGSRVQASGAASESPEQLPLPPGWEVSNCSMPLLTNHQESCPVVRPVWSMWTPHKEPESARSTRCLDTSHPFLVGWY